MTLLGNQIKLGLVTSGIPHGTRWHPHGLLGALCAAPPIPLLSEAPALPCNSGGALSSSWAA